jgi:predicted esterase
MIECRPVRRAAFFLQPDRRGMARAKLQIPEWEEPQGVSSISVCSRAYYAIQLPEQPVDKDTRLLCVLHGWGQRCPSFLRRFRGLREQNIVVVAPQGPHQFYVDMERRKVGFSWLTAYDRNHAVLDVASLIHHVVESVQSAHGLERAPVVLGFSQGVSIAYRYHLLAGYPVRGIVACGGDLPRDVRPRLSDAAPFPVLVVHGDDDTIVPRAKAEEAVDHLKHGGLPPDVHYFPGGHEIDGPTASHIGAWVMANT